MRVSTSVAVLMGQGLASSAEFCGAATLSDHTSLLQNLRIKTHGASTLEADPGLILVAVSCGDVLGGSSSAEWDIPEIWTNGKKNCGKCKVLAQNMHNYGPYSGKCSEFCKAQGRTCVQAEEAVDNTCVPKTQKWDCDSTVERKNTWDMLCTCGGILATTTTTTTTTCKRYEMLEDKAWACKDANHVAVRNCPAEMDLVNCIDWCKNHCDEDEYCTSFEHLSTNQNRCLFSQTCRLAEFASHTDLYLKNHHCTTEPVWTLVLQYGTDPYIPTSGATIAVPSQDWNGFAKLSDTAINSLPSDGNPTHDYYMVQSDGSTSPWGGNSVRDTIIVQVAGDFSDLDRNFGWGVYDICSPANSSSIGDCTWLRGTSAGFDNVLIDGVENSGFQRWFTDYQRPVQCLPGGSARPAGRCFSTARTPTAVAIRTDVKMYRLTSEGHF